MRYHLITNFHTYNNNQLPGADDLDQIVATEWNNHLEWFPATSTVYAIAFTSVSAAQYHSWTAAMSNTLDEQVGLYMRDLVEPNLTEPTIHYLDAPYKTSSLREMLTDWVDNRDRLVVVRKLDGIQLATVNGIDEVL